MGTIKRILDNLIEMSELERKTSISVNDIQVFEYLITFSKGLTKTVIYYRKKIRWFTLD